MNNENKLYIETMVTIFMVDDSETKVLLVHKIDDPYKGYWMLPKGILNKDSSLLQSVNEVLTDNVNYNDMYLLENKTFGDVERVVDNRIVGVSYIALTDPVTVSVKFKMNEELEYQWFNINSLPKLAYDHLSVIENSIRNLRNLITKPEVLISLYPGDFTLPEIQRMFENLLNVKIDRRNFRKRLLNMEWIEETGTNSEKKNGRPGKLYYFRKDIKEKSFF